MKKYFAKYIPSGGEIKVGDKVFYQNINMTTPLLTETYKHIDNENMLYDDGTFNRKIGEGITPLEKDITKVELYLCSHDIKPGDEIRSSYYDEVNIVYKKAGDVSVGESGMLLSNALRRKDFKIIGKISPKAKWIKENDEFDENEILQTYFCTCRKTYRNGEHTHTLHFNYLPTDIEDIEGAAKDWAENDPSGINYGYTIYWPDSLDEVKPGIIKIKCSQCETFH